MGKVQIQEYLTAAIQNIKILLKHVKEPATAMGMQVALEANLRANRMQPCGLINLINAKWDRIAQFYRAAMQAFCYPLIEVLG